MKQRFPRPYNPDLRISADQIINTLHHSESLFPPPLKTIFERSDEQTLASGLNLQ